MIRRFLYKHLHRNDGTDAGMILYDDNTSKKIKLSKTEKTVVNFGLNFTDQLTL